MKIIFEDGPFAGKSKEMHADPVFPRMFYEVGKEKDLYQLTGRRTIQKPIPAVVALVYSHVKEAEWHTMSNS